MITIAAMTLALVVELLYAGLVTGMFVDMQADVTEMDSGEIQVLAMDYLERPSLYSVVEEPHALVESLEAQGYAATPRLMGGGLGASGDLSSGVALVGVDPVRDTQVLALNTALAEGLWVSDDDPLGVVVGRGLARTLDLSLGSELVVLSQGTDGSMANELYQVRGILMSVAAGLDRTGVVMTEDAFRDLMVLPDGAHKVIVRTPDDVALNAAADQVTALAPGHKVMTWEQLNPILAQMLAGVQSMIAVIYLIVYVAVAILILNAMLMAVFERIREFGVLKAIGYSPLQVLSMMVLEGMIQASVALVAGLALAAGPMWYIGTHGIDVGKLAGISMVGMTMPAVWRGVYNVETLQTPIVLLFVISFVAVLWPAIKAARSKPVDAMHHT
jgi:ABC-type lipoprotein release transport system permease subunit